MIQVYFIRHGESAANAGAVSSSPSQIPLTAKGHEQALQLVAHFERPPTLIVVSSYLRTRQTAEPTIARFPDAPVEEWSVQEFTYLAPSRYIGTTFAQRRPAASEYWNRSDPQYRDGPGAESFSDLLMRIDKTIDDLRHLPADSRVAIFTHGQFIQAMRMSVLLPGLSNAEKMLRFLEFDRESPIANASVLPARIDGGASTLTL